MSHKSPSVEYMINPESKRRIKIGGQTHTKLLKKKKEEEEKKKQKQKEDKKEKKEKKVVNKKAARKTPSRRGGDRRRATPAVVLEDDDKSHPDKYVHVPHVAGWSSGAGWHEIATHLNRTKMPASSFLDPVNKKYPYKDMSGSIDCRGVRAAKERALLNMDRGIPGASEIHKKAQDLERIHCNDS